MRIVGVDVVVWLWLVLLLATSSRTRTTTALGPKVALPSSTRGIQPKSSLLLLRGKDYKKKAASSSSSLSLLHAVGGPDHDDEDSISSISSSSSSASSASIAEGPSSTPTAVGSSWQSHVSTHPHALSALQKVLGELGSSSSSSSSSWDLVFLFVGPYHTEEFEDLVNACQQHLDASTTNTTTTTQVMAILGAGGVIGEGIELDEPHRPSLSILAGRLPANAKVELATHHYHSSPSSSGPHGKEKEKKKKRSSYLVFGDPWSNTDQVLNELATTDSSSTSVIIAGGISCPANLAKVPSLAYNGNLIQPGRGVVTMKFSGSLQLQTLVSQGCRPISSSSTYTITAGEGNIIETLNGRPALQVLKEMVAAAPESEVPLIESSLLGGILVNNESSSSSSQDGNNNILARQLVGFVPEIQGIAIAGRIQKGDQFVFQVRDAQSAQDDLKLMLQRAQMTRLFYRDSSSSTTNTQPLAALQISCVARGRSLYQMPNVDHSLIQSWLNEQGRDGSTRSSSDVGDLAMSSSTSTSIPIGGFFANGEIGSVGLAGFAGDNYGDDDEGGRVSYIHGFTTVVALLCETTTSSAVADDEATDARATLETARSDFDDAWG